MNDRPLTYWMALSRLGFEDDLARIMKKKGISKSDLAKALDVSPAFITKVLSGNNNYQLQTLVKMARGVGAILEIRLADEGSEVVRVLDVPMAAELDSSSLPASETQSKKAGVLDFVDFVQSRHTSGLHASVSRGRSAVLNIDQALEG